MRIEAQRGISTRCSGNAATTATPAARKSSRTYTSEFVDGWNAVMRPAGITSQDLTSLRDIIATEG